MVKVPALSWERVWGGAPWQKGWCAAARAVGPWGWVVPEPPGDSHSTVTPPQCPRGVPMPGFKAAVSPLAGAEGTGLALALPRWVWVCVHPKALPCPGQERDGNGVHRAG